MWMGLVRIKTLLKNAQMQRGGAFKNSAVVYEHGMCVLIRSINTYDMGIETLEYGVTSAYALGEASGNRYREAYYSWNIQIINGKYGIIETYTHRNMAIDVY